MDFHAVANLFPMMDEDEYEALKADIRANGLLEPIWTHEGQIIDGRNRFEACQELGVVPTFRKWSGHGSLVSFVVSLNVSRRHLNSSQRASLGPEIIDFLEAEARERQLATLKQNGNGSVSQTFDTRSEVGRASQQAALILGTNRQYISDAKRIKEQAPELLPRVRDKILSMEQARGLSRMEEGDREAILDKLESGEAKSIKEARKLIKAEAQSAVPDDLPPDLMDRCQLLCGDMQDVSSRLEDESIDVILTDPPYAREYLPLYEALALVAARVLKPGGSLLCMAGQSHLPDVFNLITPHLSYQWTVAYLTPGGQAPQIWDRKVNTFWKPVLWFAKGEYAGHWVGDVAKSDANDKRFHHWGQSESGIADLMERFTLPGQTILDPFMGGGTVALVALQMNRRFVGIDNRLDALERTLERLRGLET